MPGAPCLQGLLYALPKGLVSRRHPPCWLNHGSQGRYKIFRQASLSLQTAQPDAKAPDLHVLGFGRRGLVTLRNSSHPLACSPLVTFA